jgi:hypothetical protein
MIDNLFSWFDEECSELLDQRKQAKLWWLWDPDVINGDNLNNIRRETSMHFRNKEKEYIYCDGFAQASLYSRPRGVLWRLSCATGCSEHAVPYDIMLYSALTGDVRQRWEAVYYGVAG